MANDSTPYGPGFASAQAAYDNALPPELPEPASTPDTAYLDIRVWTGDIERETLDTEEWMTDEFKREVELKVALFVASLFYEKARWADAESEWYESAWPCPELEGPQHEDQCGEPTTRRQSRFSATKRGVYRVCAFGKHETPADAIARMEVAR